MEVASINRDFRGDNHPRETRINERVRAREVRLIDEDGQMAGVMSAVQALAMARDRGLDLVEVSPMAVPPVCKLMDYGRFKYDQAKRESEARRHQKTTELKEIRLSPRTDEHDLNVKVRKIEEFLADGDKVKLGVRFRGREMAHPELGRQLLDRVVIALKNAALVERPPVMEGKMVSMILTRAPGWEPQKKATAGVPKVAPSHGDGEPTTSAATPDASDGASAPALAEHAAARGMSAPAAHVDVTPPASPEPATPAS